LSHVSTLKRQDVLSEGIWSLATNAEASSAAGWGGSVTGPLCALPLSCWFCKHSLKRPGEKIASNAPHICTRTVRDVRNEGIWGLTSNDEASSAPGWGGSRAGTGCDLRR